MQAVAKPSPRAGKVLNTPLYAYCEPGNAKYARVDGKKKFGSFSGYVNALIAKDRGVKPKVGFWKPKEETKKAAPIATPKKKKVAKKAKKKTFIGFLKTKAKKTAKKK